MKITTGKYKFKQIKSIKNNKLRPTTNKIRNAVFDILINRYALTKWAKDGHLLDAFSGTGIISLEGFSRNIAKATLIESDNLIFNNLKKNIKNFNLVEKVILINSDFFTLKLSRSEYSLVYLDPPYLSNYTNLAINKILDEKSLKKNAIVVCETKKNHQYSNNLCKHIEIIKQYGNTSITFFKFD
ncbi:MAG: 16S rRNA (guanine(966)-N(2))-methyltransferase RsmD [Pelagibacterales bacterium]|nr:16S rRNA (guanine(966)-N(2))-methyltransferase RsmD [Pelagibacterales bacterium]OUU63321.1 MAG: 16S rRNA (guanine(966)-N(2))-methyltransferase RsmD [Alphaproteobacteria bacterium TMED62]|tara:strand:+ start:8194 stop:8748 length:555 start_codon:yes stop_codon:yes gene_type:complete